MDTHFIPFSGKKICKAKQVQRDVFRITLDNSFIGHIRKENGGWMLEEYSREELTAENVQIIGNQIDRMPWQMRQY